MERAFWFTSPNVVVAGKRELWLTGAVPAYHVLITCQTHPMNACVEVQRTVRHSGVMLEFGKSL